MILIRIKRDEAGHIASLQASGHALFAEAGLDVVCAGVSALLQTALLGLEKCAGAHPSYRVGKGSLRFELPDPDRRGDVGRLSAVLLDSALLGLREIEGRYPGHIRIEEAAPARSRPPRRTPKTSKEVST